MKFLVDQNLHRGHLGLQREVPIRGVMPAETAFDPTIPKRPFSRSEDSTPMARSSRPSPDGIGHAVILFRQVFGVRLGGCVAVAAIV